MDDVTHEGAAGAETLDIGAVAAPGRERRLTARRQRDAVLRVVRGEPLEIAARELAVTAADASGWRETLLEAGSASLKSRARDNRDEIVDRPRTKVERPEGGNLARDVGAVADMDLRVATILADGGNPLSEPWPDNLSAGVSRRHVACIKARFFARSDR